MPFATAINRGAPFAAPASLLLTGLLLALNFNLAKHAMLLGAAPVAYLFGAILGAAIAVAMVGWMLHQPARINRTHLRYGLLSGFLSIAAPNTLLFLAIPHVGASFAVLTGALPPLTTYALALILGMERAQWLRAAGLITGVAGALLLGWSKLETSQTEWGWVAATLAVPVIVGMGNIYRTRAWPKDATSLQLAPLMLAGAALWIGVTAFLIAPQNLASTLFLSAGNGTLATQIGSFSAMYVMYFILQKLAGPVYFSQIGTVGAAIGTPLAVFWFGEALPAQIGVAATLIVAGVFATTLAQRLLAHRAAAPKIKSNPNCTPT